MEIEKLKKSVAAAKVSFWDGGNTKIMTGFMFGLAMSALIGLGLYSSFSKDEQRRHRQEARELRNEELAKDRAMQDAADQHQRDIRDMMRSSMSVDMFTSDEEYDEQAYLAYHECLEYPEGLVFSPEALGFPESTNRTYDFRIHNTSLLTNEAGSVFILGDMCETSRLTIKTSTRHAYVLGLYYPGDGYRGACPPMSYHVVSKRNNVFYGVLEQACLAKALDATVMSNKFRLQLPLTDWLKYRWEPSVD